MNPVVAKLNQELPCRSGQIQRLHNLFGNQDEPFPSSVYVCGGPSVGKSIVVTSLLQELQIKHVVINLIECYTSKILLESILNKLTGHEVDYKTGQPYAKCDSFMEFIEQLKKCASSKVKLHNSVIVLDKAEELRGMEFNLLIGFLRLRELSNLQLSVIFLSDIIFSKYYGKNSIKEPIKIYFPQYSNDELLEILALDYNYVCGLVTDLKFDITFFRNYLNTFLSVFYNVCRDLSELRYMSRNNFLHYCEPIKKNECKIDDHFGLWNRISSRLKESLQVIYLRISPDESSAKEISLAKDAYSSKKSIAKSFELPFYAKYLLIAAYLASYNPAKEDKRLFVKYHGKKKKTKKDIRSKSKVSELLQTQLGPKPFTLDRLLAIFYAILDEKIGFNNHLLVQISTLVELNLLTACSNKFSLDSQKYKCNVNREFIHVFSMMVGFNIKKYLVDFSHN